MEKRWKKDGKREEKREIGWKTREKDGKRPHITGPHLFLYEEKLSGIWALYKMRNKCCTYSIKSDKKF